MYTLTWTEIICVLSSTVDFLRSIQDLGDRIIRLLMTQSKSRILKMK